MTSIEEPKVLGLTPEERSAVETFYKALEGNPELLDKAVTEDWQDVPLPPYQQPGRDGIKPLIDKFTTAFPDVKVTIHEIIGTSGRVAVRASISGTHLGEWFGIAPTRKPFVITTHEFHHIADGKLTHTWHLVDWFGWLPQVGVWPIGKGEIAS